MFYFFFCHTPQQPDYLQFCCHIYELRLCWPYKTQVRLGFEPRSPHKEIFTTRHDSHLITFSYKTKYKASPGDFFIKLVYQTSQAYFNYSDLLSLDLDSKSKITISQAQSHCGKLCWESGGCVIKQVYQINQAYFS